MCTVEADQDDTELFIHEDKPLAPLAVEVGVTQEGSEGREYCSQLFYLGQPNPCKIHFVVTWNIEGHLTVSITVLCK